MIVGSLGDIVFEVSEMAVFAPDQFTISRDYRYEEHAILGDLPRPEFTGPDLFSTSLDLFLRSDLGASPLEDVRVLEEMAQNGEVLRLIIANANIGKVTIRKISQNWRRLAGSGAGPAAIALTLELKEYQ